MEEDAGCACDICGKKYRVDVNDPDDVWELIRPPGSALDGGMLCGGCIFNRIEGLGEYGAFDSYFVRSG